MLVLTIRTDKPEAEVGLYEDEQQLGYEVWPAGRQLSVTLQAKIEEMLKNHGKKHEDLQGIICYKGPGSFTGLRIGLTVADALAYGLAIPIVAETADWIEQGIARLRKGDNERIALPEYGAPVHITTPKR